MGLYNFKAQFVPHILNGSKTHTIRATRAHVDKPGNTVHLYTGLRQRGARLLMRATCTKVEAIHIENDAMVSIDGLWLDPSEREQLARRDGFGNFAEMMQFWEGRLPFAGHIIHSRRNE
jgi:hypothetical protein